MDNKELKSVALLQRIGELASEYEGKIADLRVTITMQESELKSLRASNAPESGGSEVLEGEVV